MSTPCEIVRMWVPQNPINEKSTLVQVMTLCRQAITWSSVDPDLCRHNELAHCVQWRKKFLSLFTQWILYFGVWLNQSHLCSIQACHGIAVARLSSGYLLNIGQAWAMAFCSAGDKPLPQPVRSKIPEVYPGGNPPVTGGSFSQKASNAELWCILCC